MNQKTSSPKNVHPKDESNFLSHLFFCWELLLVAQNHRNNFTEENLKTPAQNQKADHLGAQLEKIWNQENLQNKPSLIRALLKLFGTEFLIYGLIYLPFDVSVILLQPLALKKLLEHFTKKNNDVFVYGACLASASFLRILILYVFFLDLSALGLKVRVACSSLIYRRILKMKKATLQNTTLGQIVNLLSNDVERFDRAFMYLHFLWISFLKIGAAAYFFGTVFGWTILAGIAIVILQLLFQVYAFGKISRSRSKISTESDNRIRLTNDVVCGIQAIKMYVWEKFFASLVTTARRRENKEIARANFVRISSYIILTYLSKMSVFLCVVSLLITDAPLTVPYLYAMTILYDLVRISSQLFVSSVTNYSEIRVAIARIEQFLLETSGQKSNYQKLEDKIAITKVAVVDVDAKWNLCNSTILQDVGFEANMGDLVAVVGPPGGGKTTLLQTILAETEIVKGIVETIGTVSYASQEPWIFPASIKDNILFGEEMDVKKYAEVLEVCALDNDLSQLPFGDNTLIGDRGVMLSGGQKSRINLARAVYKDADIYLLDDQLSAVDTVVAQHIFSQCVEKYLRRKIVVLVTHQVHFLRNADRIYVVERGKVKIGKHYDAVAPHPDLQNTSPASVKSYSLETETEEDRGSGTAKSYRSYFSAAGPWTCLLLLLTYASVQIFASAVDVLLTFWANSTFTNLTVCTGTVVVLVAMTHFNAWVQTLVSKRASERLHNAIFDNLISSSLTFFNKHSSGRVLNRFSKDLGIVDEFIPFTMEEVLRNGFVVVGATVLITIFDPWLLLPAICLYVLIYFNTVAFWPVINFVKKLEGTRRSPIFTHVSATINGLSTIRASRAEPLQLKNFDSYLNEHSAVSYTQKALYYSYSFWTDVMCALFSGAVIFSVLFFRNATDTATVGLIITQSVMLVSIIQYTLRSFCDLDSQMVSVGRLVQYTDLTPEKDDENLELSKTWPPSGLIAFEGVSLRYSPEKPLVLDGITLTINAGEKVGIVGRTGSGKSSLISTLFRLFDFSGTIYIDGIDTKLVPLRELRSKIAIIPQEPVLFSGSLRQNLDPFAQFTDSELWSALAEVDLKKSVSSLEMPVLEKGANFSVGQKQLICLIRAILKSSKIVVLDEATASVDLETDRIVQNVIRKRFRNCTVLMIAHRTDTVLDCDKILVMESGKAVEFGRTEELLQNGESFFWKYVNHRN